MKHDNIPVSGALQLISEGFTGAVKSNHQPGYALAYALDGHTGMISYNRYSSGGL